MVQVEVPTNTAEETFAAKKDSETTIPGKACLPSPECGPDRRSGTRLPHRCSELLEGNRGVA